MSREGSTDLSQRLVATRLINDLSAHRSGDHNRALLIAALPEPVQRIREWYKQRRKNVAHSAAARQVLKTP